MVRIFKSAWVLPVISPPIREGAVVLDGAEIVAVGPAHQILAAYGDRALASSRGAAGSGLGESRGGPIVDLGEAVLTPAFTNAHTHLELSWMAADPPPRGDLTRWIRTMIGRRPPPPGEIAASIRGAVESLRAQGTALVGDVGNTTAALDSLRSSGLHGCFFLELIRRRPETPDPVSEGESRLVENRDAASPSHAPAIRPDPARIDEVSLVRRERIAASLVPHSPATGALSEGLLEQIGHRARRRSDTISVHIAESQAEVDFLSNGSGPLRALFQEIGAIGPGWTPPGRSPARILDDAGLLGPRTLAVHGVHLTREDARLIARRGASVVLCPRSNAWIGVGEAPVGMLMEEAVPLALGTDSLASNEDLDMLAELAALRRLAPRTDPAALFRAATLGGAAALGRASSFGSLEPGKVAALLALRHDRLPADRPGDAAEAGGSGRDGRRGDVTPSEVAHEPEPWATLFAAPARVFRAWL